MPLEYRFYKDDFKTAALYRTTFVTLKAIEHCSSDKSQPDILRVKLCCSMTLRLKSPDKTNPTQRGKILAQWHPKILKFPLFCRVHHTSFPASLWPGNHRKSRHRTQIKIAITTF